MIKMSIELFQDAVTSCRNPKSTGPIAARRYPDDCAIPDSSAASECVSVRKVKNIIASPNEAPPAIPMKIIHKGINDNSPANTPP